MMLYLAIVLVFDFGIGFMLGILIPPASWLPAKTRFTNKKSDSANAAEERTSTKETILISTGETSLEASDLAIQEVQNQKKSESLNSAAQAQTETWDDFISQFKDKAERVRYSQQLKDTALGSRAHTEFHIFTKTWYHKFQSCLEGSSEIPRLENFEPTALELLVAQIETSLTNSEALPWSEMSEEAFEILLREINLLDEQLKKVIKSTKRSKNKCK